MVGGLPGMPVLFGAMAHDHRKKSTKANKSDGAIRREAALSDPSRDVDRG